MVMERCVRAITHTGVCYMVCDSSLSWITQHSHWLCETGVSSCFLTIENNLLILNVMLVLPVTWSPWAPLFLFQPQCMDVLLELDVALLLSLASFFALVAICGIAGKNSLWPNIAFYQQSTIVKVMSVKLLTGHLQLRTWSIITLCVICFIIYVHEYLST